MTNRLITGKVSYYKTKNNIKSSVIVCLVGKKDILY